MLYLFLTPNSRSVFLCWSVLNIHSFIDSFTHSGWVGEEAGRPVQVESALQAAVGAGPQGAGAPQAEGAGGGPGPAQAAAAGARTHEAAVPGRRGEGRRQCREEGTAGDQERAQQVRLGNVVIVSRTSSTGETGERRDVVIVSRTSSTGETG